MDLHSKPGTSTPIPSSTSPSCCPAWGSPRVLTAKQMPQLPMGFPWCLQLHVGPGTNCVILRGWEDLPFSRLSVASCRALLGIWGAGTGTLSQTGTPSVWLCPSPFIAEEVALSVDSQHNYRARAWHLLLLWSPPTYLQHQYLCMVDCSLLGQSSCFNLGH